jgi:hypothetical protein
MAPERSGGYRFGQPREVRGEAIHIGFVVLDGQ